MEERKTILLVEDDFALAMGTEYTLKAEGYEIRLAKNLAEARELIHAAPEIRLILLDVMLPDGTGFDFLKELRDEEIETPVIFLTAVGDEANIVRGLDLGADDYVTKPYRVKELISRITAILRREDRIRRLAQKKEQPQDAAVREIYNFGSHTLNAAEFRLYKGDTVVECTPSEIRLLREFLRNEGITLTRNQLIERLYDTENSYIDDNTLSVYIKRLRDKLGDDAVYICTMKGVGYRFSKD